MIIIHVLISIIVDFLLESIVPILWYDDIRKYIARLRKWFLKEYGEKIRYYIICEYGSQSFRPHYHILLFHDSPRARADFRIVRSEERRVGKEC